MHADHLDVPGVWSLKSGQWRIGGPATQFMGRPALNIRTVAIRCQEVETIGFVGILQFATQNVREKPKGIGPSDAVWQHPKARRNIAI